LFYDADFKHKILSEKDIPRFAELDVIPSCQPIHCTSDYLVSDKLLGKRGAFSYPFKTLLKLGSKLKFGSDCPVETCDPWVGLHAAVTRERASGEPKGGWYPLQRLTVLEGLRCYADPLKKGAFGDLIIIDQNVFEVDPNDILKTKVLHTVVGGEVVYSSK
jgi:predicted amidohydrolase YtcJ